jgi:hypothetical protein
MKTAIEHGGTIHKLQRPKLRAARNPRRLFVPVNEFDLAAFSIRPRLMRLAQTTSPKNQSRAIRVEQRGLVPCQHFSS